MFSSGISLWSRSVPGLYTANEYADYLLANDFDNSKYWQTADNTGASGTTETDVSQLAGYSFTASGSCYAYDSGAVSSLFVGNTPVIVASGYVAHPAVTNLLLNAGSSSGLATQDVTVSAVEHTLSFVGTGEVVLSGVHSATLTGTGASNRATLTFTPSAGTLTCTVTGSVTYASLNTGKASVIVPTTGSAATRGEALLTHNLFADGSALVDEDMLIWVKGTPGEIVSGARRLAIWVDASNIIQFYLAGSAMAASVVSAGSTVYNQSSTVNDVAGAEATTVLRRLSGAWRVGAYVGGTLTWGTSATAAFPAGLTKAVVGNGTAGSTPFRGTIDSAFIETGTFDTDAKVITALTEAP